MVSQNGVGGVSWEWDLAVEVGMLLWVFIP